MGKNVLLLTGAGQIGMAIARRVGSDMKIIIGDKKIENAKAIAKMMKNSGFDTIAIETDIFSRDSIKISSRKGRNMGK